MNLLRSIQEAILQPDSKLAPVLLKLRLLAARLGSQPLADWVRHESEGYPVDIEVPSYRIVGVSFTASFTGAFGAAINNAPIAPFLIEKFAGKYWTNHKVRQSIASVDELLAATADDGSIGINADNLILLLQGKVYPDYNCFTVSGSISRAAIVELQHAVRSRILELTIELEKAMPEASDIEVARAHQASAQQSAAVTQIAQQIIYGGVTSITAAEHSHVTVINGAHDPDGFVAALTKAGIREEDAQELKDIIVSEKPQSAEEPFGKKARHWLIKNLEKAADGTWKIGVSVATAVLKEAALRYYGLK